MPIDVGMTCGFGVLGEGFSKPVSGTFKLRGGSREMGITGRHFDQTLRELNCKYRPTVMCFASPFVGQIFGKPTFINGQKVWGKAAPVRPDVLRPMMGMMTIIEMICQELRLRCIEVEEPDARRAFMGGVPRKSKDIKAAVQRACDLRHWDYDSPHAADALCVGSFVLEQLNPGAAHRMTPLFGATPAEK